MDSPITKVIELKPIKDDPAYFDRIERVIKNLFMREIFRPVIQAMGYDAGSFQNAKDNAQALYAALSSGRVTFNRGTFSGRFNATVSKELKRLGAQWDRKSRTFKIPLTSLPLETRNVISATEFKFQEKIAAIDKRLAQITPEEISAKIKLTDLFDSTLWKVDKRFQETVKGITVAPQLTPENRKKIAADWQNNLELYIKDWAAEQIPKMREDLQKTVFTGNRWDAAIQVVKKHKTMSDNKAKFLARQESKLLIAKFQEVRYADAGVYEYTWHHVAGTPKHPVRPKHRKLGDASTQKGTVYRFDDPPNTAEEGEAPRYNNPGQDYNCRCFARPVVKFKR